MNISLHDITQANYEAICLLDVHEDQEDFVASNTWSLVESHYNSHYTASAIYLGTQPVGFFMWVQEKVDQIDIWRFMVDKNHQQKGIGKKAFELALLKIRENKNINKIGICYDQNNSVAKKFYATFGFKAYGLDEDQQEILAMLHL